MKSLKDYLEIVLVTYNREIDLRKTLEQILAENSPIKDLDIKILNNASTDSTPEVIKEYADKHKNITHIRHKINIGGNGNIARAFETASKKYLWVLCDDDTYEWTGWEEVEKAIFDDYDVILTRKVDNNIADIFYTGTFVPACIYKTQNITSQVYINALDNIRNFFPHLAILAKNINDDNRFFCPKHQFINVGLHNASFETYIRGLNPLEIPETRRNMFWAVAYFNSIELVIDRQKQLEIIENLRHGSDSLFKFFVNKTKLNAIIYDNSLYNLYCIFKILSFKQKCKFVFAYLFVMTQFVFLDYKFTRLPNIARWTEIFKYVNQDKYIKSLSKKYKNKKVLLYGTGTVAQVLFDNYDMSELSIVAVSDKKYVEDSDFRDYKAVSPENILKYNPDVILFTLQNDKLAKKYLKKLGVKAKMKSLIKKNKGIRRIETL